MREGCVLKTLGDLFSIGSSKRVYESQWRTKGVPFYRAREIVRLSRDGYVDNELFIDEELYVELSSKYGIPKAGDIMVTGVGTLGICYIVKENDRFYFKDGNTLWFKTKEGTNPQYVQYAFKSEFLRRQIDNCVGATVGTFTIERANKTTIPVPSFEEQERIVAELDLLTGIIDKQKQQLKELDILAQSIFYDMFGNPVDNDKGWTLETIEKVCSSIVRGPFGSALKKEYFVEKNDSTYKVYEQKHAIQKNASIGSYYISEDKFQSLKRFEVHCGDIIMSCSGTIGELFEIPMGSEKGVMNQALLKFTLNRSINKLYFLHLMDFVKDSFEKRGTGLQNIGSVGTIKAIRIALPPIQIQESFAKKIQSIESQKESINRSLAESQKLFDYTMDKYFG